MNKLASLPKPFFVLAPMDDVTDTVFRQVVADCAPPDLFFTEFVNVDGLQSPGRERLMHKLWFKPTENPIIAQIWGKDPENFKKTAAELVDMGFDGVDINMGCPVKEVVNNGCCSALINNRDLASAIIGEVKQGVAGRVPVSVKCRIGFNQIDLTWIEFLLEQKLDMLTIHARTRKEMSEVPAHWDVFEEIVKMRDKIAPKTILVGNGDVTGRAQGEELASKYNLDGIMIGRGIFQDPFVFKEQSPWAEYTKQQKIDLFASHIKLFAQTYKKGERRSVVLNKFCKIYVNGFDGASAFRSALMLANNTRELIELIDNNRKALPLASYKMDGYDRAVSNNFKAIVFDSDGTLLDTRDLILEGYKTVLTRHGLAHLATNDYIRQRLGKPVPETYEQILAGHHINISVDELAAEHDEVQDASVDLIKPYPHAEQFLRQCKTSGIKLCLFTSGTRMMIERNFAGAHMADPYELFDAIVTADDEIARKPEPDAILELLRRVVVEPENAVVVGDHGYDLIAAARAKVGLKIGMVHGFGTPGELLGAGANLLAYDISSLSKLMRLIAD